MKLLSDDDEVTLPDCALLPRLFHIVHACHGIKGVKVQDETTNLTGKQMKRKDLQVIHSVMDVSLFYIVEVAVL